MLAVDVSCLQEMLLPGEMKMATEPLVDTNIGKGGYRVIVSSFSCAVAVSRRWAGHIYRYKEGYRAISDTLQSVSESGSILRCQLVSAHLPS